MCGGEILDGLTRSYSRHYLASCVERELSRSQRYAAPVSLVLITIDHPELIGRHGCDRILVQLAAQLRSVLRQSDLLARYDEVGLALLLPETALCDASELAARLLHQLADGDEPRRDLPPFACSMAVAACPEDAETLETLSAVVEQRIAVARGEGGDCVVDGAAEPVREVAMEGVNRRHGGRLRTALRVVRSPGAALVQPLHRIEVQDDAGWWLPCHLVDVGCGSLQLRAEVEVQVGKRLVCRAVLGVYDDFFEHFVVKVCHTGAVDGRGCFGAVVERGDEAAWGRVYMALSA